VSNERRRYSREFKLAALARFERAENVGALARELGIRRQLLYKWWRLYAAFGAEGLRTTGRPRPTVAVEVGEGAAPASLAAEAGCRIAELERKIGQQPLELDFFRAALRHVREQRRVSGGPGGSVSSR
jgi:transposase